MKNHLKEGGSADLRDKSGLAARVVGEVGFIQPRTGEAGANLTVSLYYLPSATDPLNEFERAISVYNAVFLSRSDELHPMWPTAFQYKLIPLGLTTGMILWRGGVSPLLWGWPTLAASTCVWIYNVSSSMAFATGRYLLQGSLLKLAWGYPILLAPL